MVLASDALLVQDDLLSVLNEIQVAVSALAGAKGVLSDLRVTPTGTGMTVAQATSANLNANVSVQNTVTTNLGGSGNAGTYFLTPVAQNWQNQTSQQAFTLNVARS